MATLVPLPVSAFVGDVDAQLVAGDAAGAFETPAVGRSGYAFDDTDEEAIVSFTFEMPDQYTGSGLAAVILGYFKTETTVTDEAVLDVFVEAETPGAGTIDLEAASGWDSANSGEIDPVANAGYLVTQTITLTNADSVAAGDAVRIGVRRDTDAGADTATGDFVLLSVTLEDDG